MNGVYGDPSNGGSLPAPVVIIEERTVGPTLGADSIRMGLMSMITGGILVIAFMVFYYKGAGIIADIALVVNILLIGGGLAAFQATLTLPGIAGIILTIGMAVDANVIIFERIREELRSGKTVLASVHAGFDKATITILDANVTTFIAALVLYQFGLPLYYLVIGFLALLLFIVTLYLGFLNTIVIASLVITVLLGYLIYKNKKYLRHNWMRFVAIYFFTSVFIISVDYVFNNVFEQRHRDRFNILLGKDVDTQGIGYNTAQSVITIGSGGISGKGFLQGDRTQGDFVPEQQTDYIFSTVGEEWGFLGSSLVILLFVAFLIRLLYIADRQKSIFSKVFSYATVAIFFFHFTINIGMVIGLLPTIGIPLPFFSYGGSSLWGFTVLLFIMIRLDADRVYEW
jgi:protein-export SecD/SecF family membrane protein